MADEDRNRVIVLAVVEGGLSVSEAAARFGVSRQWVHRLVARYRTGGADALKPQSRAPRSSPTRTPDQVRAEVLRLRDQLSRDGWDAGAQSIADRMSAAGSTPPSRATIHRILTAADRVTPEAHKRPRSSWRRFAAAAPNGCWQSDMTHWHLAGDEPVEIITWLDDHSRKVMHISAHPRVTGDIVTDTFLAASRIHGLPASTLTDNGMIFTTRFARGKGGPNHFEHVIDALGITQKNGSPGHPQTQGKIERFHQTLKKWLTATGDADTLEHLQAQLDRFKDGYNTRPHRALNRATPQAAYDATPKDGPTLEILNRLWRVRHDIVDTSGVITVRFAGKLRHLAIGRAHKHHPVMLLVAGPDTLVIDPAAGEIIAEHTIDPERDYQPKKQKSPSRRRG